MPLDLPHIQRNDFVLAADLHLTPTGRRIRAPFSMNGRAQTWKFSTHRKFVTRCRVVRIWIDTILQNEATTVGSLVIS